MPNNSTPTNNNHNSTSTNHNINTTNKTAHRAKPKSNTDQKKKKVTIMIILVTLNFAIGWFPTHLFIIIRRLRNVDPNTNEYVYLQVFKIVAHTLSYMTPVVNVCLYAFFNENFQKPLYEIYLRMCCRYEVYKRRIYQNQNRSCSLKTSPL